MTLHSEPPLAQAPQVDNNDLPTLIVRPNKRPRVPLLFWLRHPRRAWWITRLIKEAFQWRVPSPHPNVLTWAEKVLFGRAQQAQEQAIAAMAGKIEKLAGQYQALRAKARSEHARAEAERERPITPPAEVHVFAAGVITKTEVNKIITRCQERIAEDTAQGQTRHLERPAKRQNLKTTVPLLVDVAALMAVIAKIFNVTPTTIPKKIFETVTVVGFSLIAAWVLALLAHSAGQAAANLRAVSGQADQPETRRSREFPPARALLYIKLAGLFVVSATVAISIAARIVNPSDTVSSGFLGVLVAIMVGTAAFLAPWLIVSTLMRSGSLEIKTIDTLTEILRGMESDANDHDKAASDADQEAEKVRQRADQAQTRELRSAMDMTAMTRQIVELARSFHMANGRFALSDNAPVDNPYLSMQEAIATDTSPLDEAMRGFTAPEDSKG